MGVEAIQPYHILTFNKVTLILNTHFLPFYLHNTMSISHIDFVFY